MLLVRGASHCERVLLLFNGFLLSDFIYVYFYCELLKMLSNDFHMIIIYLNFYIFLCLCLVDLEVLYRVKCKTDQKKNKTRNIFSCNYATVNLRSTHLQYNCIQVPEEPVVLMKGSTTFSSVQAVRC